RIVKNHYARALKAATIKIEASALVYPVKTSRHGDGAACDRDVVVNARLDSAVRGESYAATIRQSRRRWFGNARQRIRDRDRVIVESAVVRISDRAIVYKTVENVNPPGRHCDFGTNVNRTRSALGSSVIGGCVVGVRVELPIAEKIHIPADLQGALQVVVKNEDADVAWNASSNGARLYGQIA